jgi:hypothetical protein
MGGHSYGLHLWRGQLKVELGQTASDRQYAYIFRTPMLYYKSLGITPTMLERG